MYCCLCQSSRLYLLWSNKQEVTLWSLSLQVEASYSSSQSGSNTLSSNASSSAHSDEKWYEIGSSRTGVRPDSELNGYLQGASTDSGIDATSYGATGSGGSRAKERRAQETSPSAPDSPGPPGSSAYPAQSPLVFPPAPDSGSYTLSDAASHSRCVCLPVLCYPT